MGLFNRLFGSKTGKEEGMKIEATGLKEHGHSSMAGTSMAKDPVCGMEVNKEKAPSVFLYLGQTLYFCSPSCQRLFRGNPDKYIKGTVQRMSAQSSHHM